MQDRIVIAGIKSNSIGIALPLFGIAEREVVADQVIVGTIGKVNTVQSVVIGGVSIDCGIGGAVEVDTGAGRSRHRAAGIADMVVREGDIIRTGNVNAIIGSAGYSKTVDYDVAFA